MKGRVWKGAALAAIAATVLAACSSSTPSTTDTDTGTDTESAAPVTPTAAAYTANDFSFDGPDTLPAGTTDITMTNEGQQPHFMVVSKLEKNQDWTAEDAIAYINENPKANPDWAPTVAGIFGPKGAPINPGETGEIVFVDPTSNEMKPIQDGELEAGSYMLLCFVTDPASKKPHAMLGMVKKLTVS